MNINDPRNLRSSCACKWPPLVDRMNGARVNATCLEHMVHEGRHFHWTKVYSAVANGALADPGFFWPDSNAHLTGQVFSSGPVLIELFEDASASATGWLTGQAICNKRVSEGTLNSSNFQVKLAGAATTTSALKMFEMQMGRAGVGPFATGGEFARQMTFITKINADADPQLCYYLKCTSQEDLNNISIVLAWGEPEDKE